MTTAREGGEGSASRPGRSLPQGKTRYPLYRRLGGPQGRSGQVRKISPPPGFDPRTVQPVASRYTDWATRPTTGMAHFEIIFPLTPLYLYLLLFLFNGHRKPFSGIKQPDWNGHLPLSNEVKISYTITSNPSYFLMISCLDRCCTNTALHRTQFMLNRFSQKA